MTSLEALLKEGTKVLEEKKIQEAKRLTWLPGITLKNFLRPFTDYFH